jgi:hypothetical protein
MALPVRYVAGWQPAAIINGNYVSGFHIER